VPAQLDSANNQVPEGRKVICRAAKRPGPDVVIGHGPHVLNGVEMYRGKPIFYSLGHFYMSLLRDAKALPRMQMSPSLVRLAENGYYLEEYRWAAVARVFVHPAFPTARVTPRRRRKRRAHNRRADGGRSHPNRV
jgi:poly-gamma-glutamate capsule biosynthesis protein CapA/YwtB (metallophosphatase superfamily)